MKTFVAILSIALVALGGTAIHLWRQLNANRQQVADLKAQVDTTAASTPRAPPVAPSPSLPLAEPAPDADRKALEDPRRRAFIAFQSSPEASAQMKAAMMRTISDRYPDVGEVLGLSRDEVDQLLDLLYKQADRRTSDPLIDAEWAARLKETEKDELASLLGSKYAKWEEYTAELPTRQHVRDLSAALDAAGTPLIDAQNNSLLQALVAEERRNSQMSSDRPIAATLYRFTPEATQNLLNASSAYLTPQQMETYRQVLERASIQETELRNSRIQVQQSMEALRRAQQ